MTVLANAHVVTMDDAGTELAAGWIRIENGFVAEIGSGTPPEPGEDLAGAVVTPALINTHHHLFQTLTRARAQEADLFTWLRELYPLWARLDAEAEYAAARTGLAELALSGCGTVFDHHYVFPDAENGLIEAEVEAARELGVRIVASRGSMDLAESDGGLPPEGLVEELDAVLADTERLAGLHEPGPGARVQLAVAPCSPFSVTGRLMEESAELARRLELPLHTHLAETAEEEAYCPAGRVPRATRLARGRCLVRALRPPRRRRHRQARRHRHRGRALPDLEPAPRRRRRARATPARRGRPRRPRRRRLGLERARRPTV